MCTVQEVIENEFNAAIALEKNATMSSGASTATTATMSTSKTPSTKQMQSASPSGQFGETNMTASSSSGAGGDFTSKIVFDDERVIGAGDVEQPVKPPRQRFYGRTSNDMNENEIDTTTTSATTATTVTTTTPTSPIDDIDILETSFSVSSKSLMLFTKKILILSNTLIGFWTKILLIIILK